MIDQHQRDLLLSKVKRGQEDYETAAKIYFKRHGMTINARYLEKFLKGLRTCHSGKPKRHEPVEMYRAVADAIKLRHESEEMQKEMQTSEARTIYANLIKRIKQDVKTAPIPA